MSATALIRRPSSHLDEGIVSHIEREPVDVARAVGGLCRSASNFGVAHGRGAARGRLPG
jgi:hypothetical protein